MFLIKTVQKAEMRVLFSLTYTFINKRPELDNIFMPRNGYGLKLTANFVDKNIWGDFTYNHYEVDSYFNKKFGHSLFIRELDMKYIR